MLQYCQYEPYATSLRAQVLEVTALEGGSGNTKKKKKKKGETAAASQPRPTHRVRLSDTVLFPEGGGQPSDRGSIDGVPVLFVARDDDGVVWHHTEGSVAEGSEVEVLLDWERRYDHMQQHTGQHLLSAVAMTMYQWPTESWELGAESCNVDLAAEEVDEGWEAAVSRITARVNAYIREGFNTSVEVIDEGSEKDEAKESKKNMHGALRIVRIGDLDRNPCCGTHLRSTSELQMMLLLAAERRKGGVRIRFVFGGRAVSMAHSMVQQERQLKDLLSCGREQWSQSISRLQGDVRLYTKAKQSLENELAVHLAAGCIADIERTGVSYLPREDGDGGALMRCVAKQVEGDERFSGVAAAALFTSSGGTQGGSADTLFLVIAPDDVLKKCKAEFLSCLDARGGGPKGRLQGKVGQSASVERALASLSSALAGATAQ